jgi:hypothetical protein
LDRRAELGSSALLGQSNPHHPTASPPNKCRGRDDQLRPDRSRRYRGGHRRLLDPAMPPPPAARSHPFTRKKKAAPTTAQKARGSTAERFGCRARRRRPPFHLNRAPRMRQPATVAAKPQRRGDPPPTPGFLQKRARASAFIPQQWHQERNTKPKLFPPDEASASASGQKNRATTGR